MSNLRLDEDVEAMDEFRDEESDDESFGADAEGLDDEEEDAEESRASRRRRREQHRRALLNEQVAQRRRLRRRRAALARSGGGRSRGGRGAASTRAAVRSTQDAVRDLDIQGRVRVDELRRDLERNAKATRSAQYTTAAIAVTTQFQNAFRNRFGILQDPAAQAAISFAPLLLLSPAARGWRDPRLAAALGIGGIFVADKLTQPKPTKVSRIIIASRPTMVQGATLNIVAEAVDDKNNTIPGTVFQWASSNTNAATVNPQTGHTTEVTAVSQGFTFISATAEGVTQPVQLEVVLEPVRTERELVPAEGDGQVATGGGGQAVQGGGPPDQAGQAGTSAQQGKAAEEGKGAGRQPGSGRRAAGAREKATPAPAQPGS